MTELKANIQKLEENLWEIHNLTQLIKDTVIESQEDIYIQRSVSTIEKLVKSVCENDLVKIKQLIEQ